VQPDKQNVTKHFKYSKGLHVLTLCCFLMPFFYSGCHDSKEEKEKNEELAEMVDTIATTAEPVDMDSAQFAEYLAKSVDTSKTKNNDINFDDPFVKGDSIFNCVPFLKPVLNPDKECYSGLGLMIAQSPLILMTATFTCFLLLIISLTIKYIDHNAKRAIVLLEILALISLLIARPYSFQFERLWGLWVAVFFVSLLTIYDFYIARVSYLNDKKGSS
jgi:hypothetical protein